MNGLKPHLGGTALLSLGGWHKHFAHESQTLFWVSSAEAAVSHSCGRSKQWQSGTGPCSCPAHTGSSSPKMQPHALFGTGGSGKARAWSCPRHGAVSPVPGCERVWRGLFFLGRTEGKDTLWFREQFSLWCHYVMGGKQQLHQTGRDLGQEKNLTMGAAILCTLTESWTCSKMSQADKNMMLVRCDFLQSCSSQLCVPGVISLPTSETQGCLAKACNIHLASGGFRQ